MGSQFAPLSKRQVEVLRWVADGCPDGVWADFSYKTSAYALVGRGLVTVKRRADSWTASITDSGRSYLKHGTYYAAQPARRSTVGARRPSPAKVTPMSSETEELVTPESLLTQLESAGGRLTLSDPPRMLRAAYQKAISKVISSGLIPDGYLLTHSGRPRGDLVICLVSVESKLAEAGQPKIAVPQTLDGCHAVVRALRDTPALLQVSDDVRQRALLISQAIAEGCARRGYTFGLREDGKPSFKITVGDDSFDFTLSEELERGDVPSGQLILCLDSGYGSPSWAERKRSTLHQKLPAVFTEIARRASAQTAARMGVEEERRRRCAWEEAIPGAKHAYIHELNLKRLREQCARSAEAEAIRSYCARLDRLAEHCDDPEQASWIKEWVSWGREEADRIDPIRHPDLLRYLIPSEVNPPDFEKFMSKGMNASYPPS